MDLSGIIFVMLAVAWAVYLIPKALKQHDEVARTRSIDRFSSATRVLARREPVSPRDARLVVHPPRTAATPTVAASTATSTSTVTLTVEPAVSRGRLQARRTAARAAARRRRRILTFLLACVVVAGAAAYLSVVPRVALAVPVVLTLAYLVLCRTQVRHENVRDRAVLTERAPAMTEPEPEAILEDEGQGDAGDAPIDQVQVRTDEVPALTDADGVADFHEGEDTVGIPVELLEAELGRDADRGNLWDPLPVTLPTYVTKPRARRTVRTIDLGEAGTWTSGRTAEDAEIAARATDEATGTGPAEGGQRAVGS